MTAVKLARHGEIAIGDRLKSKSERGHEVLVPSRSLGQVRK
jgi:hypothetical protein